MEQRTCNIIMACKGHCEYARGDTLLDAVKSYISKECDFPYENYGVYSMWRIMSEALYDYMRTADNPGFNLRDMFYRLPEYAESSAMEYVLNNICTMFELVGVKNRNGYVNGFTEELILQSEVDLGK